MSNFIDDFENDMQKHANAELRRVAKAEKELQQLEKEAVDLLHDTEIARRKAIAERKITLDWAWVAAELLNAESVQPEVRTYTYYKKKRLWGQKAMQGIALEGWHLLDWQNTHYWPGLKHTLILSPREENNSYLRYFSEQTAGPGISLQPSDVHSLPVEPLSENDMPWPGLIHPPMNYDSIRDIFRDRKNQKTKPAIPWQEGRSLTFDAFDSEEELKKMLRTINMAEQRKPNLLNIADYDEYKKANTERTIRSAIAEVAALHLKVKPEQIAATVNRRRALGLE